MNEILLICEYVIAQLFYNHYYYSDRIRFCIIILKKIYNFYVKNTFFLFYMSELIQLLGNGK